MCDQSDSIERARRLAEALYGPFNSYHQHKELMGHAAVLVEGSLFVVLMSGDNWRIVHEGGWVSSVVVTSLFLIIHVYMRWELRYRRLAADQLGGLRKALAANTVATAADSAAQECREAEAVESRLRLWELYDHLWPFQKGKLPWDYYCRPAQCPQSLSNDLQSMDSHSSRPIGEWLPTLASVIMFVAILVRMSVVQCWAAVATILVGLIWLYFCLPKSRTT
jgi:hypothetical protein